MADRREQGITSDPMVYRARKRCGHIVALLVDTDDADYVADNVAEFIRDGLTVERVTLDVARKSDMFCDCDERAVAR